MSLDILTSVNIIGTSTNTPTTVTRVAPDCNSNKDIDTTTANSKKLFAYIIPEDDAIECGNFQSFIHKYAIPNIKKVCIINGIAINTI